jgi:hypothetical protein
MNVPKQRLVNREAAADQSRRHLRNIPIRVHVAIPCANISKLSYLKHLSWFRRYSVPTLP